MYARWNYRRRLGSLLCACSVSDERNYFPSFVVDSNLIQCIAFCRPAVRVLRGLSELGQQRVEKRHPVRLETGQSSWNSSSVWSDCRSLTLKLTRSCQWIGLTLLLNAVPVYRWSASLTKVSKGRLGSQKTKMLCFELCLSTMSFLCTIHLKRLIAGGKKILMQ